jgi:hypothetical protein
MSPDRGGARHPLVELTLARLREFVREPEALFWAFLFPVLMSVAMAVAFPARGTRAAIVAIETGPGLEAVRRTLSAEPAVTLREIPPDRQQYALREGLVDLVLIPTSPPTYRFDAAREEGRVARLVVDDALKRAAGRSDPFLARDEALVIAGSRYIDWLIRAWSRSAS